MTTVQSITGRFSVSGLLLDLLYYLVPNSFFHAVILFAIQQLARRLLMGHQPKTGEVEELPHLTSFLSALELLR